MTVNELSEKFTELLDEFNATNKCVVTEVELISNNIGTVSEPTISYKFIIKTKTF